MFGGAVLPGKGGLFVLQRRIEFLAGAVTFVDVRLGPVTQVFQRLGQAPAHRGQAIFYSASDLISMGFIATPTLAGLVTNTKKASDIDAAKFDAIIVAGGRQHVMPWRIEDEMKRKKS